MYTESWCCHSADNTAITLPRLDQEHDPSPREETRLARPSCRQVTNSIPLSKRFNLQVHKRHLRVEFGSSPKGDSRGAGRAGVPTRGSRVMHDGRLAGRGSCRDARSEPRFCGSWRCATLGTLCYQDRAKNTGKYASIRYQKKY